MDLGPPLLPIVIDPLEVTLNGGKFTSAGDGLLKNGHKFDPSVKNHLPLLEPARTKAGTVRVHQPYIKKQPLACWKAQSVFRGLTQSGTMSSLQAQLRGSDAGMDAVLAKAEKQLNQDFREKNAGVRDEKWNNAESNESKAQMDPTRFLREFFRLDGDKESTHEAIAVVLKTRSRMELHEAADSLKLEHQSVDAPHAGGVRPEIDRWIIISKTRSALTEKIRTISREKARMDRILEDESNEQTRKLNQKMIAGARKSGKEVWDVTGNWRIRCPGIERQWGKAKDALTLDIFISNTSEGRQMWAEFDFNVITGMFRFIKPASKGPAEKLSGGQASKRKCTYDEEVEENGEDEDEELYPEDSDNSSTPQEFILSANDKPTSKFPKWDFRWRGEETGEGQILLSSDECLCSIKFHGTGGCKLTGTFEGSFAGKVEFTGLKIGKGGSSQSDPTREWNSRSERAYEAASIGRWR